LVFMEENASETEEDPVSKNGKKVEIANWFERGQKGQERSLINGGRIGDGDSGKFRSTGMNEQSENKTSRKRGGTGRGKMGVNGPLTKGKGKKTGHYPSEEIEVGGGRNSEGPLH